MSTHCKMALTLLLGWLYLALHSLSALADSTQQPLQLVPKQGPTGQPQLPSALHDIYGPIPVADALSPLYIGLAILLLLVAAALFWWWKRRQPVPVPVIPPAVVARNELMRAREMMTEELALGYMERVSTILRNYLEARFHLPVSRQTTREFLTTAAKETGSIGEYTPALQQCLERCDMAKFAHQTAGTEHLQEMEESILQFVNSTEPQQQMGDTK